MQSTPEYLFDATQASNKLFKSQSFVISKVQSGLMTSCSGNKKFLYAIPSTLSDFWIHDYRRLVKYGIVNVSIKFSPS